MDKEEYEAWCSQYATGLIADFIEERSNEAFDVKANQNPIGRSPEEYHHQAVVAQVTGELLEFVTSLLRGKEWEELEAKDE